MVTNKVITKLNSLLIKRFGIPKRKKSNPLNLLIATILSQNTNDKNSYQAYKNLKANYSDWKLLISEDIKKIEQTIKIAGLGKQKSRTIKSLLSELNRKYGKVSLDFLKSYSNEKIIDELTSIKGIGVKTVSCVLLFSLNRNVCPVDTHVHRTLNRIGIVRTNSPVKTFYLINENLPKGIAHSFHTNMIRLGREYCKSRNPICNKCPILKMCEFENKNNIAVKIKENDFMLLDNI
ncbi:MAG: endonuclease III [Ignavibacteriales bacterium]|nr:endonuclease III [Ignavibacteriales bacterium]